MPRGVYQRKNKNKLPVLHQEFPLDAIPERPSPVTRIQGNPQLPLIALMHRMMDHQERLMELVKPTKQKRGKYKRKGKGKT